MNKTLAELEEKLNNLVDKEVSQTKGFGIEFGTYSPNKLKSTPVKNIVVSPYMNLKLVPFMNENNSNFILTLKPLPIIEEGFPLSEKNFELLRALIQNNIRSFRLTESWISSPNGSLIYFLQTLGISKFSSDRIKLSSYLINSWSLSSVIFKDFLTSLSHLCKRWSALSYSADEDIKVVLDFEDLSKNDIALLKEKGINTIISFKQDSTEMHIYQENRMNFLFIPFIDYSNIALRKFSQVLQLETDIKVIFYPQELIGWLEVNELK